MKYKHQKFTVETVDGKGTFSVYFCNTPTSCITFVEGDDIYHPGLNLTESGEWIPAPGFPQSKSQDEVGALRHKIAAMTEREDAIVGLSGHDGCIDNLPKHIEEMTIASRRKDARIDELARKLVVADADLLEAKGRLDDALEKLRRVEEWAKSKTDADPSSAAYEDEFRVSGVDDAKHVVRQMLYQPSADSGAMGGA